ncbi:hypothetical protein B4U79_12772 [Dinothrombium tinctorium]|uniref:ubiquitinyl hydrolase 1 n=1 Tax=Dinothrombium tinctorium TaxID=1965070 RepID=A0A443QVN5_9ACAR|nr:hypothetical protein B4U79_12772 [Dinothrombium tinctorium]
MCDTCAELIHLIADYESEVNTNFVEDENENDNESLAFRPLKISEVNTLCNYLHFWQQRHCNCIFKDLKNFDKLNLLIQGLLITCLSLLKSIIKSLSTSEEVSSNNDETNGKSREKDTEMDYESVDFDKWSIQEKEKLLHLVSKTFHIHFPLYTVHKHNVQSRLEDLTQREAALLSTFCDPSDAEIPILLLKNVSFFCEHEAIGLLVECFSKATPNTLNLGLAHAIIAVISNLKYVINVNNLIPKLVLLRTCVISYLCKIPDKDLRIPSNRNMFEFMWSVIKDPLDPRCVIDKEGLALALKYFTSSTLTMRLAGIAQINNYISLFNEFCQTESGITPRQADGEELVDWILSNKIIEHIFGPNLHVEVIKQSHIVLNFIVSHITPEHIDVIWSASQLKHCSRQVFDTITPLIKNMNVGVVLHLYSLMRKMEPKDHTEQTLILASCLLRFIWTKSLNIPEPSSVKGICNPLEELAIVKSPIFTILPGSSSLRRHDTNHSSTSASVDGSDEDEDDDFDIVSQKLLAEQQMDSRIASPESGSSCGTQSSSDEAQEAKNNEKITVIHVSNCKLGLRPNPNSLQCQKNFGMRQKYERKPDGVASDSDEESSRLNKSQFPRRNLMRKKNKSKVKEKGANKEKSVNVRITDDETANGCNLSVNAVLSDQNNEMACTTEGDDLMSDSNSNSSQVSQSSQKNMADFDGEESGSGCETELIQLSNHSIPQKNSAAHHLANIACIHTQNFRGGQNLKDGKDHERFDLELSKFTIDNVCKPGQTLLWDLLQDNAIGHLAEGLAHECEKILCNLICWLADRRIRMKFIEGCLENLSQNNSVIISLRLLPKLLMSFQQYRGGMDTHSITLWADNERQMLKHFFSNLILYSENKNRVTNELHTHLEEMQTRLHFLSFVFSFPGSPENFRLNRQQVDTLWSCLATDIECRDELFNWMLNQVRIRDQHALDSEMFHYILMEKMPQLAPDNFSMLALELLHYLCSVALSSNHSNEVVTVAIKQLWDIALRAVNTDVSMSAIKHLNNYYVHLQHPSSMLEKEEEFIKQCMDYLKLSLESLHENEEKNLTIIQRALILLKTHLEAFRCRYSFHLRLLQLNVDISIVSHLNKSCERSAQQIIKVICQPAAVNERTTFEMNSSDFIGELRAEVTFWWKNLIIKHKNEAGTSSKLQNLPTDGPLRLLSQGQELTQDLDEKTLSEVGFKDMQLVYVSVGANRPSRRVRDSIEPASNLPAPPKDRLPSVLLLQPVYFEQLFDLVQSLGSMKSSSTRVQVLSRRVWEIIHILPTSPDLLQCFQSISATNDENMSPSTAQQGVSKLFNSLLSPSSPQKLIYSLQIVEWLQNTSKNEENGWSQKFINSGGLQHLFEIFVSGVLQQGESDSWNEWKQDCLASLLQLIYQFGISSNSGDMKDRNDNLSMNAESVQTETVTKRKRNRKGSVDKLFVFQFNSKLLEMLNDVDAMLRVLLTILSETTSIPADVNSYQTGFWCRAQIVHHTLNFLTSWAFSDPLVRTSFFNYPNVGSLLKHLVLDDPDPAVRREACTGFYRMCLGVTTNKKNGLIFIPQLLNSLLSFLPIAQSMRPPKAPENDEIVLIEKEPFGPGCKDYFWLVCRLVDSLDNDVTTDVKVDLDHWCAYLAEAIEKREVRESRHSVIEDEGLRGLISLITVFLKHNPPFKTTNQGRKFLLTVFELLFAFPNQKERNLPKCKMQATRSAAFDLILELIRTSEENHISLIKLLCEQHSSTSHSTYPWDYWPHDDCRSDCGYVGLINLGATCYMASCVQHLFMLPEARFAILSAKITNETKHSSILQELQKMFAFLLESERKAYNPKNFCKVYTMDNQPLNTGEQKDMTEFFTDLISKMEEMVPLLKEVVKNLFSGTLSNNVVSLDCPHISRTTEEFYTLRCKVADMRHLWDSLDELTVKDTLEGDNMYTCSQCGRKVRAEKRACIKKLPRILCFNTMRYTFNMVTMTKEKVNTHFSFPLRLDMSPYLEKNLVPGYGEDIDENDNEEKSNEYELIGVTVHTGTADGGHYYSFIREPDTEKGKDKWYMFNDAEVKLFDSNQIAAECFGGEMTSKTYDSVHDKFMDFSIEKTNSAYMLFYERLPKVINSQKQATPSTEMKEQPFELSSELAEWIWEDNMQFLRDKSIFEHNYFDFIWQVCSQVALTSSTKIVVLSTQLSVSFVLETLIHSKEKPTIANWIELLTKQFNASAESCEWLIDHLADNYLQWPVQILLKCPNQMVRQLFQRLCIHVISQLRSSQSSLYLKQSGKTRESNKDEDSLPDVGNCSCITRFVRKLLLLIKCNNIVIKPHLKHLTEYFTFLYEFAKMGEEECMFLLKVEAISIIVQFYLSHCKGGSEYVEVMSEDDDEEDETVGYQSYRGPHSGPHINLQEKYPKPPSLDKMITLVAYLVEKSRNMTNNQLCLSERDVEAVFGGKNFPFIQRQIRDNINLKQSSHLIISLCRFNDVVAASIINMILNAINRQPEVSQPFFRILSMLVEHVNESSGVPLFSNFIYPRIWEIAEQNPLHCLEWLTAQVPRNKTAHNLVLRHLDNWVEYFLLAHANQRVRNAAALLLISLVPNNIFRQSYYKSPRTLIMQPKDGMDLTNEAVITIQQIFTCLLQLLKNAKSYVDPQTHGTAKLTSYFAVMSYCLVSRNEKLMLVPYFNDLWNLFQPKLSEPAIAVNQNKQSLLYFWYQACIDCPENVRCIVQNSHVTKNIAFNYILADHDDQEVVLFNRMMLPSYYGLLRLCCIQSKPFTRHLALHQNIQWAFKNITPYLPQYQAAVGELFKLMKLFVNIYPDSTEQDLRDIRQFKRTTLQMYLTSIDSRSCWTTLITVYSILVENDDDRAFVILNNGIIALFQSFNTLYMMFHEATACHVTNEIVDLLKIIADLLRLLKAPSQPELREWAQKWKEHGEIIRRLILLLNTYTPAEVRNSCMSVLLELIQIYPKECVPILVQSLGLGHLTFQDQYLNFSAGPYFPRRGQRTTLSKSSLRPPRPVFQMHFHPKMLEINFGTEEDYDKTIIDYYLPYYKFIASICKIAISCNLVNQELVGLCKNHCSELRALLLFFMCEVPQELTQDLKTVFSKLKGKFLRADEKLPEAVETPQKKRKTKEELSTDETDDGSPQESDENSSDHWKQRLDTIVSELMRILEIC